MEATVARLRILISAGEASADRYAASLAQALGDRIPNARFFGCAGPKLRAAGVEPVVRTEELAVVGLFEVLRHLPRIHGLYRRINAAARATRPDLAILADAPDFHLRLARKLRRQGVPVAYYVAPQVWAWRRWRIGRIRSLVNKLLVIFPFEEEYFQQRGIDAVFVGHPLSDLARVSMQREDFFREQGLDPAEPLLALLPGSRRGEALRHLPALADAAARLSAEGVRQFVLPAAPTAGGEFLAKHWRGPPIRILDGHAQDAVGHADVAVVASGSATIETALLGTPMVTFYKLSWPSYLLARLLVDVPFYSMVNLLAGKPVVAECIQGECTGAKLASEALRLLHKENDRCRMTEEFARVRTLLRSEAPAAEQAADALCDHFALRAA